jgi:hypothetical protein
MCEVSGRTATDPAPGWFASRWLGRPTDMINEPLPDNYSETAG